MAVLVGGKAVDDFIERAVAAAGDDQAAAFVGRTHGDFRGVARTGGFGEIGVDAAGGKNVASRIKRLAAAIAASAGVGIVNQQSVSEISSHPWSRYSPFVRRYIHS